MSLSEFVKLFLSMHHFSEWSVEHNGTTAKAIAYRHEHPHERWEIRFEHKSDYVTWKMEHITTSCGEYHFD